jgi:2-polyprenyl-3-methyl-5-hydroxy-6-metoxy-1,4-benzoquinol methylase
MRFLNAVRQRHRQPEIIDQPDVNPQHLSLALRGLERINWWSGSARILWPPIRTRARLAGSNPLRVLDLATGAGDVPIRLWYKARRAGLNVQVAGCDRNPHAIAHARNRAAAAQVPVTFFEWDVLQEALPSDYDVLTCSLFLHHLDDAEAVEFLRRTAAAARQTVLVNDLVRSPAAFTLAYLGCHLLTTSAMVHTDGPRSVEGAFTLAEARNLATRAGLDEATVARRWPYRYLLAWTRP